MKDFSGVTEITIPEGKVARISHDGNVLWQTKIIMGIDILVKDTGSVFCDGINLHSTSYKDIVNDEYFTFKYIPIEPGATYYAQYGTRSWFLDSEKNAVRTQNIRTNPTQYQFTARDGEYYICIAYSYAGAGSPDNAYIRKVT